MSTGEADMGCPEIEAMLTAYVDGELPPSSAGRVERHIGGCAACRRAVDDELDMLATMRERLRAIRMPAPLRASLLARLRTEGTDVTARRQSGA